MTNTRPPARTTIITVSHNSAGVLGAMLGSVPPGVEVIVVDNASRDESRDIAHRAGALVVPQAVNLGFGAACNVGAALARGEFLFFLNPDAELSTDSIAELEAAADRHPTASAFNPAITGRNGRRYFKHRTVLLPRKAWMKRGWPAGECEIPVLSGAALFCRRSAFETVGGFDEAIFLYHEDDDLALRLKAGCGPLMFAPGAVVRHLEGTGSPRSPEGAAFKAFHLARSRIYAMHKHGRALARLRAVTVGLLKLVSPATIVSRRKRLQAAAFLKGALSVGPLKQAAGASVTSAEGRDSGHPARRS
jgi:GT2 family glycosyltransferase